MRVECVLDSSIVTSDGSPLFERGKTYQAREYQNPHRLWVQNREGHGQFFGSFKEVLQHFIIWPQPLGVK